MAQQLAHARIKGLALLEQTVAYMRIYQHPQYNAFQEAHALFQHKIIEAQAFIDRLDYEAAQIEHFLALTIKDGLSKSPLE